MKWNAPTKIKVRDLTQVKQRICLRCNRLFKSLCLGHRICDPCKNKAKLPIKGTEFNYE